MRAKEFLLEYNRQVTAQNFGQKLLAAAVKEKLTLDPNMSPEEKIDDLLSDIELVDPTPHKEYAQWLAKIYASGGVSYENLMSRCKDSLERYQKLKIKKQLAPEHRDINRFKTFGQFEDVVRTYPEMEELSADKGNAKEYYKDAALRVIIPLDEAASKYYGRGTKWCTAAKNNCMFDQYNKRGHLYIVIPLDPAKTHHAGEKYQFHFESGSFMDDSDTPIDLKSWAKAYPQLKTIFHDQAVKNVIIPLLDNEEEIYDKFGDIKQAAFQSAYKLLMTDIGSTFAGMKKARHSATMAYFKVRDKIIDAVWDHLQEDSYGLVGNIIYRLNIDALQSEDAVWDNCYFVCEEWITGSDVGELVNKYDGEIDTFGIVDTIAHELYDKFVPQTAAKIKQELQRYIK